MLALAALSRVNPLLQGPRSPCGRGLARGKTAKTLYSRERAAKAP